MFQPCARQSNNPYYIQAIDMNVYSLEEINYFIYNHMNLVYREFFCEKLFLYIENELELKGLAEQLRMLDDEDATVKSFILCILEKSGFYGPNELVKIQPLIMNINNMSRSERFLMEADNCFKQGKYGSALHIYLDILAAREEGVNDSFFAKIAFSVGIIYARMFMSQNANAYFNMAYDLFPDPTYAKACVYMSIINGDDEELLRTIIKYKVTDEALAAIKNQIEKNKKAILASEDYSSFENSLIQEEGIEKQIAKWKNEYYNMLS